VVPALQRSQVVATIDEDIHPRSRLAEAPPVPSAGSPDLTSLLKLTVAAIIVATLYLAQDVVIPVVLAIMVSFVLSPIVSRVEAIGLPRPPAVLLGIVLTFGVVAGVATLLGQQAATLVADAPRYAVTVEQKLRGLEFLAASKLGPISGIFRGSGPRDVAGETARSSRDGDIGATAAGGSSPPVSPASAATPAPSTLDAVRAIVAPVLGPLETTAIVLVIAVFILMQREDLRDRFIRLAGARDLHRTTAALDDAAQRLSRYFISQVAVNGTFGLVIGVGLWVIGVPSPAVWGVFAGLLRFVPYIGPVLAALPPLLLGAATSPGWAPAIEVALLFAIVEPFAGYVVEPLLYGHSTGLAPISVIVAAVFWTWMWGPVGLILSTPMTLCLVVVGRHVKSLEFLDVLLGDRPALTPAQVVYQRMLTDNADEMLEHAEQQLTTHTLLDYYDSTLLPGLELAACDQARGIISATQAADMARAIQQVIDDLADHADGVSPGTSTEGRIRRLDAVSAICASGRGPFDDAVTAMLRQLIERAGGHAHRISHAELSRDRISSVAIDGVDVLVLSYLDLTGATAHLRYLIRRLRLRNSRLRIVVGLWPASHGPATPVPADVGADGYVSTLREALEQLKAHPDIPAATAPKVDAGTQTSIGQGRAL